MAHGEVVDSTQFELDPTTRLGYRPALDGIRAIAVIPVMVGHAVSRLAPGGYSGVRLFFVLSGFLITTLLVEEWSDRCSIRLGAFYVRRALRLLPALLLLLATYLIILGALDGASAVHRITGNVVSIVFYVANWRFVVRGNGGDLGHLWSLSVEEQFYLIWPFALVLMLRHLRLRTTLLITAVVAAGSWCLAEGLSLASRGGATIANIEAARNATQRHAYYGTDAVAYALLLGCIAALLRSSGRLANDRRYRRIIGWAGPLGVLLYAWQVEYPQQRLREVSLLVVTLGFVALVLYVIDVPKSLVAQLLSIAPLRLIGRVSYGLYLWHFVILSLLHHHQPHMDVVNRTLLAALLTAIAVTLSYKLVEQPFLRLKTRFVADRLAAGHPE